MKRKYTLNEEDSNSSSKRSRTIYKVLKSEHQKISRKLENPIISERPVKKHHNDDLESYHCVLCFDKLSSSNDIYECGHCFHKCCLLNNSFFLYKNKDNTVCPICNIYDVHFFNITSMCSHLDEYVKKYKDELNMSSWSLVIDYLLFMSTTTEY